MGAQKSRANSGRVRGKALHRLLLTWVLKNEESYRQKSIRKGSLGRGKQPACVRMAGWLNSRGLRVRLRLGKAS